MEARWAKSDVCWGQTGRPNLTEGLVQVKWGLTITDIVMCILERRFRCTLNSMLSVFLPQFGFHLCFWPGQFISTMNCLGQSLVKLNGVKTHTVNKSVKGNGDLNKSTQRAQPIYESDGVLIPGLSNFYTCWELLAANKSKNNSKEKKKWTHRISMGCKL